MADQLAVSVAEAARLLTVPERTVWAELAAGRLRGLKVGKRRLIRIAELSRYLERRELLESGISARPRAPRPVTSGGVVPFPELEEVSQRANERPNRAANNKARLSH